jgi:hypothetical protein
MAQHGSIAMQLLGKAPATQRRPLLYVLAGPAYGARSKSWESSRLWLQRLLAAPAISTGGSATRLAHSRVLLHPGTAAAWVAPEELQVLEMVFTDSAAAAVASAASAAAAERRPPLPPTAGAAGGGGDVSWGKEEQQEGLDAALLLMSTLLMVWLTAGWCVQMALEQLLSKLMWQQLELLLMSAGKPKTSTSGVPLLSSAACCRCLSATAFVGSQPPCHRALALGLHVRSSLCNLVINTLLALLMHVQALAVAATAAAAAVCVAWLSLPRVLAVLQVRHGGVCGVTACQLCATDRWQSSRLSGLHWEFQAITSCAQSRSPLLQTTAAAAWSVICACSATAAWPIQGGSSHSTRVCVHCVSPAGVLPEGLMLADEQCKEEGAGTAAAALLSLLEGGQRSTCPRAVLLPPTSSPWGHTGALTQTAY